MSSAFFVQIFSPAAYRKGASPLNSAVKPPSDVFDGVPRARLGLDNVPLLWVGKLSFFLARRRRRLRKSRH